MVAAGHGDLEAVRLLLARGAKLDVHDEAGRSALYRAVSDPTEDSERAGALTVVAELLAAGATLETADSSRGRTLLMMAALAGDQVLTVRCIEAGQDINGRDTDGMTPLLFACAASRLGIVSLLLTAGADVHATDSKKRGAMSLAHDEQIQQTLASHGLVLPRSKYASGVDARGLTRLMHACQARDVAKVGRFLEEGDALRELLEKVGTQDTRAIRSATL